MPLQNRVNPAGELIAADARGMFMGNRGVLHDENKRIVRRSRNIAWLICLLEFKGRRRQPMTPNRYTELFFLDEAVALAAGHRPCGECRARDYHAYIDAVNAGSDDPITGAKDLDRRLNASRRATRTPAELRALPDGVFVALGEHDARLIWNGALHRWSPDGYAGAIALGDVADERVLPLTPQLSVLALRHGYPARVHPSSGPERITDHARGRFA